MASSPATLETPLLMPEAIPTWRSSTELRAVAVRGATVAERPSAEDQKRRKHLREVVGVRADSHQQDQPDPSDDRSDRHRHPRPDPGRHLPEARGEDEHDQRYGRRREAGANRRVAGGLLEEQGDEEERAEQPGVDDQRLDVRDREVTDLEETEVEHRVAVARFPEDEESEDGDARDQGHVDHGIAPAMGRLLDQRKHRQAEAHRGGQDPEPVDVAIGIGIDALAHETLREPHRQQDQRHVDQEDRAPGDRLDQRAAAGGPDHRRDPGPGGPGADRLAALGALEGGREDRQGSRHQQGAGEPLQAARGDQNPAARRDAAEDRGDAEQAETEDEDPPSAELVAQRAPDEQKGDEPEQIGLDDPLLVSQARAQIVADHGQGDVHHSRIEEDDDRPQDRRDYGEAQASALVLH